LESIVLRALPHRGKKPHNNDPRDIVPNVLKVPGVPIVPFGGSAQALCPYCPFGGSAQALSLMSPKKFEKNALTKKRYSFIRFLTHHKIGTV